MDEFIDNSKREFLVRSAVLGAGAVLGGPRAVFAQQPAVHGSGAYPTEGMAGYSATGPLKELKFQRRALGPKDVAIRIDYCGVCHSDIHTIRGDWGKVSIR
jgi:hypothetical protein